MAASALLTGISLTGRADPYREATAGREPVVAMSYFGTHFHRLVLNPGEQNPLTRWPDAKIGAIRLWDSGTLWSEIAVQPGQWKFDRMDAYVEQATAHHATVLYTLGGTPRWASARPDEKCPYGLGCAAEPVRMAHWEEYVRRVVQRYRGRIKAYELWNEPDFSDIPRDRNASGFYTGSVANMVEMARIARKVLDQYDPDAVLSTPGFVNGPDRLELFLESGGKKYVQAVAYHFYSDNSDQFIREVLEVRKVMQRQGVENLPLWDTETGIDGVPATAVQSGGGGHLTYREAAFHLAQFLVLGAAAGLQHFYQYAWDNWNSGMTDREGAPLPNLAAYQKVQSWLLGARMHGCRRLLPSAVLCEGERDGKRFSIAWAEPAGRYALPLPAGSTVSSRETLMDRDAGAPDLGIRDKGVNVRLDAQPLFIQYRHPAS